MAPQKDNNLRGLNIFLAKEDIAGMEDVLLDLTPLENLKMFLVRIGDNQFQLYVKHAYPHEPSWASFFPLKLRQLK
jgi:hypothetical protein